MNVLVVMSDTLRTAYLGCYGNRTIRTPNIDRFSRSGMRFTRAYPESLPTVPVRRAIHTGRRAFPFRDYKPVKWDIVYQPGWQPISNDEDTVAENFAAADYHTGFVTDTLPCFAPGYNFQRGFWQWEYTRPGRACLIRSGHRGRPNVVGSAGRSISAQKAGAQRCRGGAWGERASRSSVNDLFGNRWEKNLGCVFAILTD